MRKTTGCLSRRIGDVVKLLVLMSLAAPQANALTLTPGTLLGIDYFNSRIWQYNQSGVAIDSLDITAGDYSGIATIGSELFVVGGESLSKVYKIDLATGASTFVFNATSIVGNLGRKGSNLIFTDFISGELHEYTTTGTLVSTISIGREIGGIDSDGSRLFASQSSDSAPGEIQVFDSSGVLQSMIGLGLPSDASISGIAYDSNLDEFWVATVYSVGLESQISRHSSDGTLLSSFDVSAGQLILGLTFIATIPEPSTLALAALGLSFIAMRRKR